MKRFAVWLVVACVFAAVAANPAVAQNRSTRSQVDALLGAYEGVAPEQWRGLGAAIVPVLESIATDQDALPTRRARSLDGLAALGSGEATMRGLANSAAEPPIVRMSAVRGLGQLLRDATLIAALRPLLQDASSQVRGVAAETLSAAPGGCAAIADAAKQEPDAWRSRFVRRCTGQAGSATSPTSTDAVTTTDPTARVVVYRVTDPSASRLYDYASSTNAVKLLPPTQLGSFSVLLPNSPVLLEAGSPPFSLSSGSWDSRLLASKPTTVNVQALIKSPLAALPGSGTLKANLFFVGVPGLTAASAPADANFQAVLSAVNGIYSQIGVQLGTLKYIDITGADATAYSDLVDTDLGKLMMLSSNAQAADGAINLFFVHSISGGALSGYVILGESAGIPGVPVRGTTGSGVAVTMADFPNGLADIESTIAHEGGHWLGLFHTTESAGTAFDPLPDTPQCPKVPNDTNNDGLVEPGECAALDAQNLMFWTSGSGPPNTLLTSNQQFVLQRNPEVSVTGTIVSTISLGSFDVSTSTLSAPVLANVPAGAASLTLVGGVSAAAPSTVRTVNSIADTSDGVCDATSCTLREALSVAQAGNTIAFSSLFATPQTINLGSALPAIAADLTITGPGANLLTVRANASGFSVFSVNSGATATISGLTIANGNTGGGGGGIHNAGSLLLQESVVSGNSASGSGGGILNDGTLQVLRSTIVGNHGGSAGALANDGTATLVNTTLSGNSASANGNAIANYASADNATATVLLLDCTIADHLGSASAAVQSLDTFVGGSATISLRNTLLARNAGASLAIFGTGQIVSLGNNLASDTGGGFLTGTGDLVSTNPLLAATLANNGGRTPTYLPAQNSPAVHAGSLADGAPLDDQRGVVRVSGDIGAVELHPLVVTSTADPGDGTCDSSCTLRDAIAAVANDGNTRDLYFDASVFNTPQTINLGSALPAIAANVNITGPGADLLTVRANASGFSVLSVASGTVNISGLTLANGSSDYGGGIVNHGALTLTDSVVSGNHANNDGGGIYNDGTLAVVRSTIVGNDAFDGGALFNTGSAGTASLTNTTLSANSASSIFSGGAAILDRDLGGTAPVVHLLNCTIVDNFGSAPDTVTAISAGGSATISLKNTLIARNAHNSLAQYNAGAQITSLGNNLASDGGGGLLNSAGDLKFTNPLLAAELRNNGGRTPTYLLALNSPAINAGNASGAPTDDQRGVPRTSVDIGAVELRPLVITSAVDPGDGTCDSSCTLRDAMLAANAGDAAAHDLFFDASFNAPQTINLSAALPNIGKGMTLNGPGANLLTVRRDTGGDYRIFTIASAFATISGMTIANGKNGFGGGISNSATLTIDRCTLTGHNGTTNGGAMQNTGLLVVTNSTISGNISGHGGALYNFSASGSACPAGCSATLTNTTVSGNSASARGGAIINNNFGGAAPTVTLINSTIAGNTDPTYQIGIISYDQGGPSTISLQNTIVADYANSSDIATGGGPNSQVVSLGNNLALGDGGGYLSASGDLVNSNPRLTSLGNYGGTTQTMYLNPGSPAINAGNDLAAPDSDQRGVLRPVGAHVDIGAVEVDGSVIFQSGFEG